MTKTGKLNKRELETLNKTWDILSRWAEQAEKKTDPELMTGDEDYLYTHACYAITGLCEFIGCYDREA